MAVETCRLLLVEDDAVDRMAFQRFVEKEALPYRYVVKIPPWV